MQKFRNYPRLITTNPVPIKIKATGKVKNIPHAHISEYILENYGLERSASIIVGAHHGSPPNTAHEIEIVNEYNRLTGVNESAWHEMQVELVKYAISISGFDTMPTVKVSVPAQIIMNGLIIMADWLARDENRFSLISFVLQTAALCPEN